MSFNKTHNNAAQEIRQVGRAIREVSECMLAPYQVFIATLVDYARKAFLCRLNTKNRLAKRRFSFLHRHHAKHLDASDYIALLITGGHATSH